MLCLREGGVGGGGGEVELVSRAKMVGGGARVCSVGVSCEGERLEEVCTCTRFLSRYVVLRCSISLACALSPFLSALFVSLSLFV